MTLPRGLRVLLACAALGGCRDVLAIESIDYAVVDAGAADAAGGAGGTGGAAEGGSACPGIDTTSDPLDCGACDHDCLGGACESGRCQPLVLAANEPEASGLAVHPYPSVDIVVWALAHAGGTVRMGSKAGGAATTIATTSGAGVPDSVALAIGAYPTYDLVPVYFSLFSETPDATAGMARVYVDSTTLAAQSASLLVDGEGWLGASGVAADTLFGYAALRYDSAHVVAVRRDGALVHAVVDTEKPEPNDDLPRAIAVDDDLVYWTAIGTGQVLRSSKDGSAPPALVADGQANPSTIAIDGTSVYWTADATLPGDVPGSVLRRRDKSGMEPIVELGTTSPPVSSIAVDPTDVYLVGPSSGIGSLRRVHLQRPGIVEDLVTRLGGPTTVALDANAVYWTNRAAGTVLKLAKPLAP